MNENQDKEVITTGHIYDGIEELDHPIPNWFQNLFLITILFGLIYFFYYILADGPTLNQEYEKYKRDEEYALYVKKTKSGVPPKVFSEEELLEFAQDPKKKENGAIVFQSKCASCHGAQGQGGIGPNLTDRYWLHGNKMTEVLATISKGIPEKGMPAWSGMMSDEEVQDVTVFIRTIVDTNPAGAKAPQGVLIQP